MLQSKCCISTTSSTSPRPIFVSAVSTNSPHPTCTVREANMFTITRVVTKMLEINEETKHARTIPIGSMVLLYMFQVRGPHPPPPMVMVFPSPLWMWVPPVDVSPVRSVWFALLPLWMWVLFAPYTLPPCGCGCCRSCMVAPPPLWMWVPPVDVSPVRSVWFAPLPLWMWVLFAPYTN